MTSVSASPGFYFIGQYCSQFRRPLQEVRSSYLERGRVGQYRCRLLGSFEGLPWLVGDHTRRIIFDLASINNMRVRGIQFLGFDHDVGWQSSPVSSDRQGGRIATDGCSHKVVAGARGCCSHILNCRIPTRTEASRSCFEAYSSLSHGEMVVDDDDRMYVRRCVELARRALGHTSPNPIVGCVIVKDGHVVGEGFHPKAGDPHAEVFALREAGEKAEGATAYVSLEPCNHFGRTPPCSLALVNAKVKRVVVGTVDPNPLVAGNGLKTLSSEGITAIVVSGREQEMCQTVNEAFFHRIRFRRPMSTLRYTMSLNGQALKSSGQYLPPATGSHYSQLLQATDAVVIAASALRHDPVLLSAEEGAKQPLRIVLADDLDLPIGSSVFDTTKAPTLIITREQALAEGIERSMHEGRILTESAFRAKGVDVVALPDVRTDLILGMLFDRGACSVLWDSQGPRGGLGTTFGMWFLDERDVQKIVAVIVPVSIGDGVQNELNIGAISGEAMNLKRSVVSRCGSDTIIEGYLQEEILHV